VNAVEARLRDAFEAAAGAITAEHVAGLTYRSLSGRASARRARPRRSSRSRFTIVAVAVTCVAAMAFVVPQLLAAAPITRPVHTAWQAFQRLPAGPVPGGQPRAAGSWRLAGYLTSTGWHGTIAGPPPGLLTCPTRSACYVTASTSTRRHAPLDSLYVTTDGTRRWSGVQLPGSLGFTSALSCVSATTCAAGAAENGQPLFASTTDGGHSWTLNPLPAGAAGITDLACPAAGTCVGLDAAGYQSPAQLQSGEPVLVTTDSGAHFSTSSFPAGDTMQQLACPTVRHCVATGVAGSSRASLLAGVAAVSSDGGATWHRGRVPAGFSPLWQVTCADAAHCWMLGLVGSKSPTSDVAASADGGLTWTREPMPRGAPGLALDGIACPTSTSCYASGGDSITENFGPRGSNGSSAVILVSQDGGGTWTRVTFAKPARIPAGMQIDAFMSAGQIQCPQAGACVSLGVSDQGSASTPVYTTGGF
jgi:photosystem II stability/assembly factor-like uncharacterized protein